MRLIDTNVFIYAVGRPHPYRDICRSLVGRIEDGKLAGNIDVELLQEVLDFFWRQQRLNEGFALFDRLQVAFPDPLPVTKEIITGARSLLSSHPSIGPRDAIHASMVLVHGLEGIVSADRDLDAVAGVTRFDPKDL